MNSLHDCSSDTPVREAEEIFIFMHRNFRVSRNIRAHWFFDHINKNVHIEESPSEGMYGNEITVVGIIGKGGSADDIVEGEEFKICLDTKITYISRYYRHVFVLDLSPSTIVADEETNCCLHTKLLECLRLSMASVTKSFTIPGTRRTFCPQIYISVCVFIPFLTFEQDLVLVHGILLTESNIGTVLAKVTKKFNKVLFDLYNFSKGILKGWGKLRNVHKEFQRSNVKNYSAHETPYNIMDYERGVWTLTQRTEQSTIVDPLCDGYVHPEWALIFMLRLGLIAIQMLPENTQSNIIVITDAVCGMPDASALQQLLNQLRSYTVSCSFIQLQGRTRSEACFGHVASCELFHFLAMASFGAYIPNCRCSIGVDMDSVQALLPSDVDDEKRFKIMNPFHRALICWCFQSALQDNVHITNLVNEINPAFAHFYKNNIKRHRYIRSTYVSTLNEILYVRLREGFTLKQVHLSSNNSRIIIQLSMPFRPLVFIDYTITAKWPARNWERDELVVDLVIHAPNNELTNLLSDRHYPNPSRQKLVKALTKTIDDILEADRVLLHIHSFNLDPSFYHIPPGVTTKYPMFHAEDHTHDMKPMLSIHEEKTRSFVGFWSVLCSLNDKTWQKWMHTHLERVVLRSTSLPWNMFESKSGVKINCDWAEDKLHDLLRSNSSFCLVHKQIYVTFVYKENNSIPAYFYMIKVTLEPPCLVLKVAFLGGISNADRMKVLDVFRKELINLKIKVDDVDVDALSLIRRPLERILVRYRSIPHDLLTIVRVSNDESGECTKNLILHNAISKYLICRRRIWNFPQLNSSLGKMRKTTAAYILSVIMQRRLQEGFRVAWSDYGVVGFCRQVYGRTGPVLEQYVLFPPTRALVSVEIDRERLPSLSRDTDKSLTKGLPMILIAEVWREPCVVFQSKVVQSPTADDDDELVSVLFTVDQLLRMSHSPPIGQVTLKVASSNLHSSRVTKSVSGCVDIVHQPFDLPKLILKSERCLVILPPLEKGECSQTNIDLFLKAIHEELCWYYDHWFQVDDTMFWTQVAPELPKNVTEMECRVYLYCHSPWLLNLLIIPVSAKNVNDFGGIPMLYCLCDEPKLAYGLAKRKETGYAYILDRRGERIKESPPEGVLIDDDPYLWVSASRCLEVQKTNYRPGKLSDVINQIDETVINKARIAALHDSIKQGFPVDKNVIVNALDEQCDCISLEIDRVSSTIETFCAHMHNLYSPSSDESSYCCEMSNQLMFSDVLGKTFKPIPTLPSYFYYVPSPLEHEGYISVLDTFNGLFYTPRSLETDNVLSKKGSNQSTADNGISAISSYSSEEQTSKLKFKQVLNNTMKKQQKSLPTQDVPLFIFFLCAVHYPDRSMDTFPLTFLPTCVHQVLHESKNQPENFDVSKVCVKLYLYVMTWPSSDLDDDNDLRNLNEHGYGETQTMRRQRFLEKLPNRERFVISSLLNWMNRLVELETVLMDSRRKIVSEEKLAKISEYINKEERRDRECKLYGRSGDMDSCLLDLSLVIQSNEALERLKHRLDNMSVDYCVLRRAGTSNMFYCCQVEDHLLFERYVRGAMSRKNSIQAKDYKLQNNTQEVHSEECMVEHGIPASRSKSEQDVKNCEESSEMFRKDALFDFWVILTIDESIKIQFCQRENGRHRRIFELVDRRCRQMVRIINQELLLNRMYELRECDPLLMTHTKENMSSLMCPRENSFDSPTSSVSDEQELDSHIDHIARFTFAPGYFACQVQEQIWFEVHPRLRVHRGSGRDTPARGYDAMRITLEQFVVRNIANTYVVKESNGNVSYMQLHTTIDTFRASQQRNKLEVREKYMKEAEKMLKTHVLLAIYGVERPGEEICVLLRDKLQKRLDQTTLDQLISVLSKNPQTRLDSSDVQFIQRSPFSPAAIFNFSIPQVLSGYLAALNYYAHQHMQVSMHLARCKEDYTSGSTDISDRRVFLPYAYPSELSPTYIPSFYLHIKPAQGGSRSTGIAVIELRLVNVRGELATMTEGRLNNSSHLNLTPSMPDLRMRRAMYRDMTHTVCYEMPEDIPGVCAYVQAVIWQSGDVGLNELENLLRMIVTQAMCDVVTEFGILNLMVIESGGAAPASPSPFTSPATKATPPTKPSTYERRQLLRKRDSSDALPSQTVLPPLMSTPSLPTDSSIKSKANSVFSFDARRGSFASEIDGLSTREGEYVVPGRSPDFINAKFVATAEYWFHHVVEKVGEEHSNSVVRQTWIFDCRQTVNRALCEICDHIDDHLRCADPYGDRVQIFENISRGRDGIGRFEAASPRVPYSMQADIGVDPDKCDVPDLLLVCMVQDVAVETLRFGFDPVGACPETLLKLGAFVSKELFLPCLDGAFIPRQRILYGTVHSERLTLYFYNFLPTLARDLRIMVTRATSWHNSRARLVREIGLHKMGITHLSPLQYSADNPYLMLVWRNPVELIDKDYPPDDLEITSIDALPKGYSASLFRLYRRANLPFLCFKSTSCLLRNQMEQMRSLRDGMRDRLNQLRTHSTIHEALLKGETKITEADLLKLTRASRLVHFVETPVLLFPKWRRKIAEVRGTVDTMVENRKSTIATGNYQQLPPPHPLISRRRANTLSVASSSVVAPSPFRFRSEDDDPCQVKILYMLMSDYISYLDTLGLRLFNVINIDKAGESHHMYKTEYPQGCRHAPHIALFKVMKGGIILVTLSFVQPYFIFNVNVWNPSDLTHALEKDEFCPDAIQQLRELEQSKDDLVMSCHLHSFTYDFHLRMLSKYLVGKDEVLFNPGYNTYTFLVDFLEYYGCRPPNARNSVYEERCSFSLQYNVMGSHVWDHFLNYEKTYKWKVVKLKNSDENSMDRPHDFMLVSSESIDANQGDKEMLRIVLRDRRRSEKENQLNLVLYLITVATDNTSPLEGERHREDSRQSDVGEFRNVERCRDKDDEAAIEEMIGLVSAGVFPTIESTLLSRRRFSSGGHLQSSSAINVTKASSEAESVLGTSRADVLLKGAESDGDVHKVAVQGSAPRRHRKPAGSEDGEIPGEHVTYVHFLSGRQRKLQKEVEDAVSQYSRQLRAAVDDAEWQCRRDQMWKKVLDPPSRARPTQSSGLSIFLTANPNRNPDPWHPLRTVSHETTRPAELETLITLVSKLPMEEREPRLTALLQGSNCARLCRFLFARFGPIRCRFFEFPHSLKKSLVLTNPDDLDSVLFLISCDGETTPSLSVLFKEHDLFGEDLHGSKLFRQRTLDSAFDELVASVTAFLWSDLLQKPPGCNGGT